jgi:type III restriction enzyme
VVETKKTKYLCEPKRANEMTDTDVLDKAKAAALWCEHARENGGKPWVYLLIPHDAITDNKTLQGLAAAHKYVAHQG